MRYLTRKIGLTLSLAVYTSLSITAAEDGTASDYEPGVLDKVYESEMLEDKNKLEKIQVREGDIIWSKVIKRRIDVNEMVNRHFKNVHRPLIDVVHEAVMEGKAQAFNPLDEKLENPLTPQAVEEMVSGGTDTLLQYDPETLEEIEVIVKNEFNSNSVIGYKLKEKNYLNKQSAAFEIHIISICPVVEYSSEGIEASGLERTLYCVQFPQLRNELVKNESYNKGNDEAKVSWDQVFARRLFNSRIIEEYNSEGRPIKEYMEGVEALYESERIQEELFNFEHDLWTY